MKTGYFVQNELSFNIPLIPLVILMSAAENMIHEITCFVDCIGWLGRWIRYFLRDDGLLVVSCRGGFPVVALALEIIRRVKPEYFSSLVNPFRDLSKLTPFKYMRRRGYGIHVVPVASTAHFSKRLLGNKLNEISPHEVKRFSAQVIAYISGVEKFEEVFESYARCFSAFEGRGHVIREYMGLPLFDKILFIETDVDGKCAECFLSEFKRLNLKIPSVILLDSFGCYSCRESLKFMRDYFKRVGGTIIDVSKLLMEDSLPHVSGVMSIVYVNKLLMKDYGCGTWFVPHHRDIIENFNRLIGYLAEMYEKFVECRDHELAAWIENVSEILAFKGYRLLEILPRKVLSGYEDVDEVSGYVMNVLMEG
ncbi:hypothetical protein DRO21_02970 [archaeon]|nr:MAG: hypothetical protein DRO21_02970 [archaeon]